ncbi:MAG: hypothetical protein U0360_00255 [Dehalococcoidia bacterium]
MQSPLRHLVLAVFAIAVGVRVLLSGAGAESAPGGPEGSASPTSTAAAPGTVAPTSAVVAVAPTPSSTATPNAAISGAPAPAGTSRPGAEVLKSSPPTSTAASASATGAVGLPTPVTPNVASGPGLAGRKPALLESPTPSPTPVGATASPTVSPTATPTAAATASPGKTFAGVDVLGALKVPLAAGDYDDDAGAAIEFHVRPSGIAGTTQLASAAFLVHLEGAQAVAALHGAIRAGTEGGPIVYTRALTSNGVITGEGCDALLGTTPALGPPSVGRGLAETGQLPASAAAAILDDCRKGLLGVALFDFPVPRELPPGPYVACGAAVTTSGAGASPGCRRFTVDAAGAFSTDSSGDGLGVGRLQAGVLSAADGDFEVGNAAATIVNTGNVPARPTIRLRPFVLEGETNADVVPGTYRVGLRVPARGTATPVAQAEAIDLESATVAVREFSQVCLRPGEVAALDFGVTPVPGGILSRARTAVRCRSSRARHRAAAPLLESAAVARGGPDDRAVRARLDPVEVHLGT